MSSSEETIGTAIGYTDSEIELLDANCLTAISFKEELPLLGQSEKELIEKMGKRAKARRRAARVAAQNQTVELGAMSEMAASDETDCEIPSVPAKQSPSKIPILQKSYQSGPSPQKPVVSSTTSPSKIPRPMAQLVYLKQIDISDESDNNAASTDEPTSYTATSGSFLNTDLISESDLGTLPAHISPLPKCDLSSEFSTKTVPGEDKNQLVVVADAGGTELKLDIQAMMTGLDLEFIGLKFL